MNVPPIIIPLRAVINNGVSSVLQGGSTGAGAIKLSAGTTSSVRSDFTFSNSPSVSFGLNGVGVITASAAPGAGAGTGFTTATTIGTNIVGTLGAGGLSMGVPAYITTAAGGAGSVKFSAGTFSVVRSDITFSNANNVSFGLDAFGVITANAARYAYMAKYGGF